MRICVASVALGMMAALATCGASGQEADDDAEVLTSEQQPRAVQNSLFGPLTSFGALSSKKPPFDFLTGGMPDRLLYFSGIGMHSWGLASYAGAQWMPASFYKDGFIMRFTMSDSLTRYTTPDRRYDTNLLRATAMPGYKFKVSNLEIQVLAGLEVMIDTLAIDQRFARLRGKIGARATADFWWEPTPSLMLQYSVSRTMIDDALNMYAATGWRVLDQFYAGPEISFSNDIYSREYRIGAHLTGFRTAEYEWSIALGHVEDNFQRRGMYGRMGLVLRPPRPAFFEN